MQQSLKGLATGLVSGAVSWLVTTQTLGITSAIAMPQGVAPAVWETVVVFGLGATVVSLLVHALALRVAAASAAAATAGFVLAVVCVMAWTEQLGFGLLALAAPLTGALLAWAGSAVRARSAVAHGG